MLYIIHMFILIYIIHVQYILSIMDTMLTFIYHVLTIIDRPVH